MLRIFHSEVLEMKNNVVDSGKDGRVKYKFIFANAEWKCDGIKKSIPICEM
jgi:hypothetical protein